METNLLAEADRLLSLDAKGREREALVTILRFYRQSEEATETLERLDREALDGLREERDGGESD